MPAVFFSATKIDPRGKVWRVRYKTDGAAATVHSTIERVTSVLFDYIGKAKVRVRERP